MNMKTLLTTAALSCAIVAPVYADGAYTIFGYRGGDIGKLVLVDDVEDTRGVPWARLKMEKTKKMFYVDRDAVYVTLDPQNPVITEKRSFTGWWISYAKPGEGNWNDCPKDFMRDHKGKEHKLYGNAKWTNTSLQGGDVSFKLEIGFCEEPIEEWGFHGAEYR